MSYFQIITTSADDSSLTGTRAIIKIKMLGPQYWWLASGYRTFLEVDSMVVTWWIIVAFLGSVRMSLIVAMQPTLLV